MAIKPVSVRLMLASSRPILSVLGILPVAQMVWEPETEYCCPDEMPLRVDEVPDWPVSSVMVVDVHI